MIHAARRELDYYLFEKREDEPWGDAIYHCGTEADIRSSLHWYYFPRGLRGPRRGGVIIEKISNETADAIERALNSGFENGPGEVSNA